MKVALVGYLFGLGGIQTHTNSLAEAFAQRGHSVCALTSPELSGHGGDLMKPVGVRTLEYSGVKDAVTGFGLRDWADVVVVCGTGHKAMLGALRTGPNCKKVFFEVMSGTRGGLIDPRYLVHAGFDAVVGQASQVELRFCQEFRWRGVSATIPALGHRLSVPARGPAAPLDRPLRFAYFGRLAAHKNVEHLIEHWEQIGGDGYLDIWGGGSESERLQSMVDSRGLGARISLCGRYAKGDAYLRLLQEYDMTLLPTIGEEGAPLVLLEAMACGVPFVANGVGGIPDYANPDCVITDGRIENFVSAASGLADRVRRGQFDRSRLQGHYRKHFSNEVLADRWELFLNGLRKDGLAA